MHLGDTSRQSHAAMIAVVLFLVFDSIALGLNFWLTGHIEEQAIGINLAGRQRMLSQRMVKVLLQLEHGLARGQDLSEKRAELALTFDLFDNTLQGFDRGHVTRGGANEPLFLAPVQGKAARAVVEEATYLWQPYRAAVKRVVDASDNELAQVLPDAVQHARDTNLKLLDRMNRLTTELEVLTKKQANQIRYYQGAAFLLALINFFGAFLLYSRRVREADHHQDLLDEVVNRVSAGILLLDGKNVILRGNRTAERLFGYGAGELSGLRFEQLLTGAGEHRTGLRKDGTTFVALTERNETLLDQTSLYIETVTDVTQQHINEEQLSNLAYHDLLTRLPNRLLFDDRLRVELAHAQRREQMLGVLFIDLDHFKPVNDTWGHDIGDLLLQEVALRLRSCLRESDTASRRGGDEFTIIVTDAADREAVAKVALTVIEKLSTPFLIAGHELRIGASVGISLFPHDGSDAGQLILHADEAMYLAKERGRGTYAFYSDVRR